MTARRKLILWGATGHARVLHEFAGAVGYEIVALFDNDETLNSPLLGVPLYFGVEGLDKWLAGVTGQSIGAIVAIGGVRGVVRLGIQEQLSERGLAPATMIHPRAFVAEDAHIGPGSQVLAQASICASVRIGAACIVNTAASIDHECALGDGIHVAPGATLAGCITVGSFSFIGPGAVVVSRTKIGDNAVIGAGAVVTRDVPANCVVYGCPAKFIRENVPMTRKQ